MRLLIVIGSVIFLPASSLLWRFILGIAFAATASQIVLLGAKVKAKASFLYTPAFVIKMAVWISAIVAISEFSPQPDVELSSFKYLLFAALLLLLDMIFDLFTRKLPFYNKLFVPIGKQGKVLTKYYGEGYKNYIEYPVVSVLYPFYIWLF